MEDQPAVNLIPHSAPLMKDGKVKGGLASSTMSIISSGITLDKGRK